MMNADGSGVTNLTNLPSNELYPVWSPDGTKIAFVSEGGIKQYEIYVMNADGSRKTNLTNDSDQDWAPDWSPR
jgi:TolB protein